MLISVIRITLFLILVAAGIWAADRLIDTPGGVTVTMAGQELIFTPFGFAAVLVVGFLALWVALRILGLLIAVLRFLSGDETAISRFFNRSRERRGLEALAHGMAALAAGEAKLASNKAAKAERLLQRPELTRLLNAQAAEMVGDDRRADAYYRDLAEDPQTAYVGVRGLLNRALAADDTDRALRLAEGAVALRPRERSALEALYMLQSRKFDWSAARKTLDAQRRGGFLPKPEANRRDAMLALAQAEDAEVAGERDHARKLALDAARLDPGNAEAAATAARHLVAAGSKRAAAKLVTSAWQRHPSPQLAAAFADIEPDESAGDRRRRFAKLLQANPAHPEARLLDAELALMTEDWAAARKAMDELREDEPTARSCAIMAAISRGEGRPEVEVRGWLARALEAPRGDVADSTISHAAMLPLLVGTSSDIPEDEGESVAETPGEASGEDSGNNDRTAA
jgi:HemY protein